MKRTGVRFAVAALVTLGGCGGDGGIDRGEVTQFLRDQGATEQGAEEATDDAVSLITRICAPDKADTESVAGITAVLDQDMPLRFVTNAVHQFCPDRQAALDLVNIARQGRS